MTEQVPKDSAVDWRCRVATTLSEDYRDPNTGRLFPAGSVVTVDTIVRYGDRETAFGDPNAVALFLNQSHNAFIQAMRIHPLLDGRQTPGSRLELDARVYDYLELIMTSIIFAYTAIEAFSNEEIPDDYYLEQQRKRDGIFVVYEKLSLIHISEPTRLLSISYAVFCLKKKKKTTIHINHYLSTIYPPHHHKRYNNSTIQHIIT